MRTILITGFGRFPGAAVNPSGLVAMRLARQRRPALAETRRIAHVFATCYAAIDRELPVLLARERPDVVILFGLAARAKQLRIEEWARNRLSAFPDAERRRPAGRIIAPHLPPRRTSAPVAHLVAAARAAGVAAAPSRNAGAYLCNYAYWRALEAAARPGGPVVVFVHLPAVAFKKRPKGKLRRSSGKKQVRDNSRKAAGRQRHDRHTGRQRRRDAWRLDDLVRAGEAILHAMTAAARSPHDLTAS